jgi:hypothetical protein
MLWFIHYDNNIQGPLSTEQIQAQLKSGEISYSAHIWGKGQVEWQPLSSWEDHLQQEFAKADYEQQKWKLRETHIDITENLSFDEVLAQLKEIVDLQRVAVCPQNEDQWTPIYSSYIFMEALGLSRRSCLRAPLMGLAKVSRCDSRFSYVVKTSTIGPGGVGLYGLGSNFSPGLPVQLRLESQDLHGSIHVNGVIKYHTDQGFVGIAFDQLPAEAKGLIVDYVNRFEPQKNFKQKAS